MDPTLFEEAGEVVRGLVPPELGAVRVRARRYGLKVWFGDGDRPPREHYEAQVVGAQHVPGAAALALEVGFHAEHPSVADNDAVIERLLAGRRRWRRVLGGEAEVAPFLGRADDWRRISETWADPDLGDPDLAMEIGTRLVDYMTALEPLRRGVSSAS